MLFDHDFVGARCSFHVVARAEVAESGRLGRAELLAKRGSIGQMQTPAELIPIPDASGCVPDESRMRRDASEF